jgi:hypothetical protein
LDQIVETTTIDRLTFSQTVGIMRRLGFLTYLPEQGSESTIKEEGKRAQIFVETLYTYLSMPHNNFVLLTDLIELLATILMAICDGLHDSLIVVNLAELISK